MIADTANRMRFERAVFTSTGSNSVRGYHLVARSPGVDDDVAQGLCQWSPTHDGLCESGIDASSLNYYLIDEERFAISKSVIGGAEYSGRSALQTVTTILVGRQESLAHYQNNPLAFAQVAMSMGWLRLIVDYDDPLRVVELPGFGLPEPRARAHADELLDRAIDAVRAGRRIAIAGADRPQETLARLFEQLPRELRPHVSFSTGIKASTFRPFQIQFFPQLDNRLRDFLHQQRIAVIQASALN